MAKPIPETAARKKRAAEIATLIDPKTQRKRDKVIDNFLMDYDEKAEAREKYTRAVLEVNDGSVAQVVKAMAGSLDRMNGKPVEQISIEGETYLLGDKQVQLLSSIKERNWRWIAVRCLAACAQMDIRIGDFKLPKNLCAQCGVEVGKKISKKKKAVKKKQ